jgi:predicted lipid-binding transport protein (Tim44 family)
MGVVLWALLGAVLGGVVALVGGEIFGALAQVSNVEGGYGMALVFVITPAGAVLGAVIGAICGFVRWRRRRTATRVREESSFGQARVPAGAGAGS